MTDKDCATPRPWCANGSAIETDSNDAVFCVAHVYDTENGIDESEARANAALIVRAVNAHDALVGIAELVAAYYEGTDAPIGIEARSALALAKGGER